jgi:hypothetical protein
MSYGHFFMATYTVNVNAIHKKFNAATKKAKTKTDLNKAYSAHKKEHERILKKHLKEEMDTIKKAKAKLG